MMNDDETRRFLASAAVWSSFAASLYESHMRYGQLTPRQQAAVENMAAKLAARASAPKVAVNLAPVHAMFDKARESGLNKMAYRACGLVLSPAPTNGRNAGAIYVKRAKTSDYLGKVSNGVFTATSECTPDDNASLATIAANPSKAATDYGRETGSCACCGRELSDPVSVELGIGPICKQRWGL